MRFHRNFDALSMQFCNWVKDTSSYTFDLFHFFLMFKNDNDKLSCEKIDFTPFLRKCMVLLSKVFGKFLLITIEIVVDMILKFALYIFSLFFFILFSLFAILANEYESSNIPFFFIYSLWVSWHSIHEQERRPLSKIFR